MSFLRSKRDFLNGQFFYSSRVKLYERRHLIDAMSVMPVTRIVCDIALDARKQLFMRLEVRWREALRFRAADAAPAVGSTSTSGRRSCDGRKSSAVASVPPRFR